MKNLGILIVEDEETLRELIQIMLTEQLSAYNLTFFSTDSGLEALDIVEKNHDLIKLVLTDINHLGLDGIEMAKRIRQNYPEIKIIVMSAHITPDRETKCKEFSDAYFFKPFTISDFIESTRRLIDGF